MKAIKYGSNNKGNGDPFPLKHMFVFFLCNMPNLKKIHLLSNMFRIILNLEVNSDSQSTKQSIHVSQTEVALSKARKDVNLNATLDLGKQSQFRKHRTRLSLFYTGPAETFQIKHILLH